MKDHLDEYGFEVFEQNPFPLAYLLTFRTYGSWLHGDQRGSFGRVRKGERDTKSIIPSVPLREYMNESLPNQSVVFNETQRVLVTTTFEEVCQYRNYMLRAVNVRTNHAHVVVSKETKPEKIVNDFKTYATRRLRLAHDFSLTNKIWARGASARYLWKPALVNAAIDYVLYCQEDVPFQFREA